MTTGDSELRQALDEARLSMEQAHRALPCPNGELASAYRVRLERLRASVFKALAMRLSKEARKELTAAFEESQETT